MKRYQVELTESNRATSPIDVIEVEDGYTVEDYIRDCAVNGVYYDGEIEFLEIEED